ncbi:DNA-binding transcriptional regulator of sugar metabolism, DeoR/GlpR family [Maribacter dokdonensis]|uniref:DNA-binding transcriptional regulator of sugar metabolism, DeoR/GlpR family n=2 Tax=Maribacter dokdonensis TaxID=320912 RepID=A0ABY0UI61_9FLAO|nr:DeoR/GlpR family DNA-binding transcription regulator [Maribacter dokdonensis]SDS72094.1 DNA-binding transcriptional regulator of sugar metabolism, DeoR/GlpR family [Maribacter dokdonensis]
MQKTDRHQVIVEEVQLHNRVLLTDLANILNVSMDTVRRDIKELDELKKLRKVHGGAISNGFNTYSDRSKEIFEQDSKVKIAKKGISLLKNGDVVLISGGSTNLELAKLIPRKMDLTFFTPSLPMAIELLNNKTHHHEVYIIGGKLSKESQLVTGGVSINSLTDISVDVCFLGTGYLDSEKGITETDLEIAQLKKAMIDSSKRLVALTISKKLNTVSRYKICEINTLTDLVTELEPSAKILESYKSKGFNLL